MPKANIKLHLPTHEGKWASKRVASMILDLAMTARLMRKVLLARGSPVSVIRARHPRGWSADQLINSGADQALRRGTAAWRFRAERPNSRSFAMGWSSGTKKSYISCAMEPDYEQVKAARDELVAEMSEIHPAQWPAC
jgi:hypothetical protein